MEHAIAANRKLWLHTGEEHVRWGVIEEHACTKAKGTGVTTPYIHWFVALEKIIRRADCPAVEAPSNSARTPY